MVGIASESENVWPANFHSSSATTCTVIQEDIFHRISPTYLDIPNIQYRSTVTACEITVEGCSVVAPITRFHS